MPDKQKRGKKPNTESFQTLMDLDVETAKMGEQLAALGLKPSYGNAVRMAALRKAAEGDMTAYRLIREEIVPPEQKQEDPKPASLLTLELEKLTDAELEHLADGL